MDRGVNIYRFAILHVMLDKKVLNVLALSKKHARVHRESFYAKKVMKIAQIFKKEMCSMVANKCIN